MTRMEKRFKKKYLAQDDFPPPRGWGSRLETGESLSPTVTRERSWWFSEWLIFKVCAQCFYIYQILENKRAKPRGENNQCLQIPLVSWRVENWQLTGSRPNTTLLHQRRLKRRKRQWQFKDSSVFILLCNYEWELLLLWVSYIKSTWITLLLPSTPSKLNIFTVGLYFFFFLPFDFHMTSSLLRCDV